MNCLLESSRSRKNVTLDSKFIYESVMIVLIFGTQIKYDFITLSSRSRKNVTLDSNLIYESMMIVLILCT